MKRINILFFVLLTFTAWGQDFPEPTGNAVNDFAALLTPQEEAQLERKLTNYKDTTSNEIAIVTITSLGAYDAMDYAIRLAENWGVGGKSNDNGILILVAKNERRLAIATGYGLEGAIPDAATLAIREEFMQPYFAKGEFYNGLDKGTDVIIDLAQGEYTAENIPGRNKNDGGGFFAILFFLVIFFFIIFSKAQRYRSGSYGNRKMDFWTAFLLGSMLGGGGRSSGSSWSDFNSGGGSFGGGGGGFGGFGGGSFGGGGSAGSW